MNCCVCSGTKNTISLPCLHMVHAACMAAVCPQCGNTAISLKAALLANQLCADDGLAYVDALPVYSRRMDKWTVNVFASGARSVQDSVGGVWVFVLFENTIQIWAIRPFIAVYGRGRFVDGLLEGIEYRTATDECVDSATLELLDKKLPEVVHAFVHT